MFCFRTLGGDFDVVIRAHCVFGLEGKCIHGSYSKIHENE